MIPLPVNFQSKWRPNFLKFASPLASKARNFTDFHILTEDPHRRYSPGDLVKGSVFLTVWKPLRVTHIVVRLHGYVKAFKNPNAPGGTPTRNRGFLNPDGRKRGWEYFGNGYASLFEDEAVVCGDGRLDIGRYEFKFEVAFPSGTLPSSVDFERGTISYELTSTLTRPTTFMPTSTCDRKIYLDEMIDVASLPEPKPRLISMEPVTRRPKGAIVRKKALGQSTTINSPCGDRGESSSGSHSPTHQTHTEPPLSPAPSEVSSCDLSPGSLTFRPNSRCPKTKSATGSDVRSDTSSIAEKTITATMKLLHKGCLPGDVLTLQISIEHIKPIKSLQGVILTFYRRGSVDSHPAMPLGSPRNGKKAEFEDYYPKSYTGLGGLSLSSAGSSSTFRKDLSQTTAPLIVDPHSLSVMIKASIKVPEDIFPTISSVPGAIISFRYFVEAVIDLGGKLAGQDRYLPRLRMTRVSPSYVHEEPVGGKFEAVDGQSYSASGLRIAETDHLKREKQVVYTEFEVIVGTRDSDRRRVKYGATNKTPESEPDLSPGTHGQMPQSGSDGRTGYNEQYSEHDESQYSLNQDHGRYTRQPPANSTGVTIPPPIAEEDVDEKTRMKRAEERLLPSAPPGANSTLLSFPYHWASAPEIIESDDYYRDHEHEHENAESSSSAYAGYSAPLVGESGSVNNRDPREINHAQIVTQYHHGQRPQDDKQELERQRLLALASEPTFVQDANGVRPSTWRQSSTAPSAPMLDEDNEQMNNEPTCVQNETNSRDHHQGSEALPLYER